MDSTTIGLLVMSACVASFIQRVSGFGFGIAIMTVLPYLMDSYGESTALSGMLAGAQSLFVAIRMRAYISWRRLLPILITFIIVSYFSVLTVSNIDDKTLKHVLGGILIAVSIYFFFFSERIRVKPTIPIQISMGTLSGMMGGFFAMQGPPAVLYFLSSEKTKEDYIAISQAYFVIGNIMMTLFRYKAGFVTVAVGQAWCFGILAVCIGTWLGTKVFNRLSTSNLKKIIYVFICISGIVALCS